MIYFAPGFEAEAAAVGRRHRRAGHGRARRAAHHPARARSPAPASWWSSAPTSPASRPPPRRRTDHHRRRLTRSGQAGGAHAQLVADRRPPPAGRPSRTAGPPAASTVPSGRAATRGAPRRRRGRSVVVVVERSRPSSDTSLSSTVSTPVSTSTSEARTTATSLVVDDPQPLEPGVAREGAVADRPLVAELERAVGRLADGRGGAPRRPAAPGTSTGRPSTAWIACSEPARSSSTVAVRGAPRSDVSVTSTIVPSSVRLDHLLRRSAASRSRRSSPEPRRPRCGSR